MHQLATLETLTEHRDMSLSSLRLGREQESSLTRGWNYRWFWGGYAGVSPPVTRVDQAPRRLCKSAASFWAVSFFWVAFLSETLNATTLSRTSTTDCSRS